MNAEAQAIINDLERTINDLRSQRDMWRDIANRLGTHMGEGLYTDDWECREYAISAYYAWEWTHGAALYAYDFEPEPVWWFREGKSTS